MRLGIVFRRLNRTKTINNIYSYEYFVLYGEDVIRRMLRRQKPYHIKHDHIIHLDFKNMNR